MTVHPVKAQISLGIHPVWSESSLCAQWVAKDPSFLHAPSEDSDQTRRMPRLIWVFAGHTCHFVNLSWGSSLSYFVLPLVGSLQMLFLLSRSVIQKTLFQRKGFHSSQLCEEKVWFRNLWVSVCLCLKFATSMVVLCNKNFKIMKYLQVL